ncbi:hypothetical protein P7K49_035755, partial [Saguinus oedipus]
MAPWPQLLRGKSIPPTLGTTGGSIQPTSLSLHELKGQVRRSPHGMYLPQLELSFYFTSTGHLLSSRHDALIPDTGKVVAAGM